MAAPLVLSIQSRVAYGHVGNSAAGFVLQRLGCRCVDLPTVLLSAHPGHGRPGGGPVKPARLADLLDGLERIGVLARLDAVLVGYLGQAEAGLLAARTIAALKARQSSLTVLVDPVMGDRADGLYVDAAIIPVFRDRLLPLADLATPNHFEAEILAGRPLADPVEALDAVAACGVAVPLVTSFEDRPGTLATLIRAEEGNWRADSPVCPDPPHGLGDTLAAALLAHRLHGAGPIPAAARAVGSIDALIAASAGLDELALVDAQDLLVDAAPAHFTRL